MNSKVKIWVGVGTFLVCGAIAPCQPIQAESQIVKISLVSSGAISPPIQSPSLLLAQGGEGGEAGEEGFKNKLDGAQLVNVLRGGGYVVFFRHAQTTKDYADQADPKLNLKNCATQRKLSDVGEKQAKMIGASFKNLKIPVGKVIASEYCRAWKTADIAFGRHQKQSGLNFAKAETYTDAQKQQMKDGIMPLLTAVPAKGMNTVLVGHDDVFDAATGIYPKPQGVAYILKPDGKGSFDIVASFKAEDWAKLPR